MRTPILIAAFASTAALTCAAPARADVITQWNFNGDTAVTKEPAIGIGAATLEGSVTSRFQLFTANGSGSSDPVEYGSPNLSYNTTNFPQQGEGDKTSGIRFAVSTAGFKNIVLSYDIRHANNSSRYEQVQYSTDGSNFADIDLFDGDSGATWFNGRSVDLSAIPGVSDNPNFAFRIVATFAPGTEAYAASVAGSTYRPGGAWRFDMVTVSGTPAGAPPASVPVPAALPLFLSAVTGLGAFRRRTAV